MVLWKITFIADFNDSFYHKLVNEVILIFLFCKQKITSDIKVYYISIKLNWDSCINVGLIQQIIIILHNICKSFT